MSFKNENKGDGLINQSYYQSVRRNMIMIVMFISFMPIILISGIVLYHFDRAYHDKVYAYLGELVEKQKQNIDVFLNEKLNKIQFIVRAFSYEQLCNESFLQNILSMLHQSQMSVFVDLGVVDDSGVQVAYAGPYKLLQANYHDADWFKKAIESPYYISDVFLGLRGQPHFIITVRQENFGKYWILRATIDFVTFNNLVENVSIGKTGFAYILNRKFEFQTKPRFDISPLDSPYKSLIDTTTQQIDIDPVFYKDKNNIYVFAYLKNGDWFLVYQQKNSDAFVDLYRAQLIAALIAILGASFAFIIALWVSRRVVSRIARVDQEKEVMNLQIIESGKLASLGELAAGIAHEINNPVAIMVEEAGWISDLLSEEEFKESENLSEFKRALNQINTQGKRCKEITHKLLSFARKTDNREDNMQINELIIDVVGLSEQRSKYEAVSIETHLQENLPLITASMSELQQVFLNLINNAFDAMEKKGGKISISTHQEQDKLVIQLKDNGPGIPHANLVRIFDPFFTTKPVGKGTGLGLSICYGIIQKMKGSIEVQSSVGEGTAFIIKLPIAKENE
ncbi:MAG: GHKL domain-containing protein [Desulfobacterales bacterium]|nr:GHKL domain-containing protein [Desulfobacterales bacterium]